MHYDTFLTKVCLVSFTNRRHKSHDGLQRSELSQIANILYQGKLKQGMSDDDITVRPWIPSNIFFGGKYDLILQTNYTSKRSELPSPSAISI